MSGTELMRSKNAEKFAGRHTAKDSKESHNTLPTYLSFFVLFVKCWNRQTLITPAPHKWQVTPYWVWRCNFEASRSKDNNNNTHNFRNTIMLRQTLEKGTYCPFMHDSAPQTGYAEWHERSVEGVILEACTVMWDCISDNAGAMRWGQFSLGRFETTEFWPSTSDHHYISVASSRGPGWRIARQDRPVRPSAITLPSRRGRGV